MVDTQQLKESLRGVLRIVSDSFPKGCPQLLNTKNTRTGMRIAGEIVEENATVVWLQADKWFADIRTFPRCSGLESYTFAGTIDWDNPRLYFHHLLNTQGIDENDNADFEFKNSLCIERGHILIDGVSKAFEETWSIEKNSAPCKASVLHNGSKTRSVRVDQGTESIAVEGACAIHVSMTSGGLKLISSVGGGACVHGLLESLSDPHWEVVEESGTNR